MLRHVGIRPTYPLVIDMTDVGQRKHRKKYEVYPDGGYRVWNDRMLKSGCNRVIRGDEKLGELIYCPFCDEYFNSEQFEEVKK